MTVVIEILVAHIGKKNFFLKNSTCYFDWFFMFLPAQDWEEVGWKKLDCLNHTQSQPETHGAPHLQNEANYHIKLILIVLLTSESMLLIVGFTKSVMVTVISGMKESFTLKEWSCFSFTLDKNLVFVRKVLQGEVQGDFSWPAKTHIQCSPGEKNNMTF